MLLFQAYSLYTIDIMSETQPLTGWGRKTSDGAEIWDTEPVFLGPEVTRKDRFKLMFYPKKWVLYRAAEKHMKRRARELRQSGGDTENGLTLLDIGCGTGASLIDFKKMFGRAVKVTGVDVVHLQIDLAKEKIKQHGVWAEVAYYDGLHLPFPDASFDVVYTSDVLGHVTDVRAWLQDIARILKPGGLLAMFAESKLGQHAYIRRYLFKRGLNVDPHAEFHISLYSKTTIKEFVEQAGFEVMSMRTLFWASFFVHPDEFYEKLQKQQRFFFLRLLNRALYWLKKKTHPYSTAAAELYGFLEMYALGKWVESQGYLVVARKL